MQNPSSYNTRPYTPLSQGSQTSQVQSMPAHQVHGEVKPPPRPLTQLPSSPTSSHFTNQQPIPMNMTITGLNPLSNDAGNNSVNNPRPIFYNPYEYVGEQIWGATGGARGVEYLNLADRGAGGGGEKRISINPPFSVQFGAAPAYTYSGASAMPYPTPYGTYASQQGRILVPGAPSETATSVDNRVIPNPIIAIGLGVMATLCCALVCSVPALVLGFCARSRSNSPITATRLSCAGLVCGGLGVLVGTAHIAWWVVYLVMAALAPGPSEQTKYGIELSKGHCTTDLPKTYGCTFFMSNLYGRICCCHTTKDSQYSCVVNNKYFWVTTQCYDRCGFY